MDTTIPIPFALGQKLWWIGNGYREEWITCPECAGAKSITMVLGNGETVSLDCAACCEPYGIQAGLVKRIFYEYAPTPFIPHRVCVDGNEVKYSDSRPDADVCYIVYAKDIDIFLSQEDCQKACDESNKSQTKHEESRLLANLQSKRRNMA